MLLLLYFLSDSLTGEGAKGQICPFADPVIPVIPFDRLNSSMGFDHLQTLPNIIEIKSIATIYFNRGKSERIIIHR
jgi:hypothetical protein